MDVGSAAMELKRQVIWLLAKTRAGKKLKVCKVVGWLGYLVCISCVPLGNLVGLSLNLFMRIKTYTVIFFSKLVQFLSSYVVLPQNNSFQNMMVIPLNSQHGVRWSFKIKYLLRCCLFYEFEDSPDLLPFVVYLSSFLVLGFGVLCIPFPLYYIIFLFRPLHGDGWKTAAK